MAISQGGQGQGSIFTEINITPLTDIFLVLLIIMMVIAPGFQDSQQEIEMPQFQTGTSLEEFKVTVEVTREGNYFVDGTPTMDVDLMGTLQNRLTPEVDKHVVVRADKSTPSSVVLKVFEAASQAGYEKLTIAGETLSTERSEELNTMNNPELQEGGMTP